MRHRAWWRPWAPAAPQGAPTGSPSAPQQDSTPVRADELEPPLAALRDRLTAQRSRLRPDAHTLLWEALEGMEGLLPSWDRCASVRAVDAVALHEVLTRRLIPALDHFLALPDADKPAHADAFHESVQLWVGRLQRHRARLTRVITSRQDALRELDGDGAED